MISDILRSATGPLIAACMYTLWPIAMALYYIAMSPFYLSFLVKRALGCR